MAPTDILQRVFKDVYMRPNLKGPFAIVQNVRHARCILSMIQTSLLPNFYLKPVFGHECLKSGEGIVGGTFGHTFANNPPPCVVALHTYTAPGYPMLYVLELFVHMRPDKLQEFIAANRDCPKPGDNNFNLQSHLSSMAYLEFYLKSYL